MGLLAFPSLYSVLCNCVLTPGENSHELTRLDDFTQSYQVRQRGAPFYILLLSSSCYCPEPTLGRGGMKEMEQDIDHPGPLPLLHLAEGLSFPGCKCPSGIQGDNTGVAKIPPPGGGTRQLSLLASRPGGAP